MPFLNNVQNEVPLQVISEKQYKALHNLAKYFQDKCNDTVNTLNIMFDAMQLPGPVDEAAAAVEKEIMDEAVMKANVLINAAFYKVAASVLASNAPNDPTTHLDDDIVIP